MAKQDTNPPPWLDSMSDGCTGVPDRLPIIGNMRPDCVQHDKRYHYGGTEEEKLIADLEFKANIENNLKEMHWLKRIIAWPLVKACAGWRFVAVRVLGKGAWNKLGPGMPIELK